MADFKIEQLDKKKILTIKGSVTIENIDALKKVLIDLMDQTDSLMINIAEISEVDITFLQLLCSAHKTMISRNRTLAISERRMETFQKTINNSGYSQHKGCGLDKTDSCLWLKKAS
jgi:anti-anti-sigma regulatory factor